MTLRELQERRTAAVVEMRGLADKAEAESRDLTGDEDSRFGTLKTDVADLDRRIGRQQAIMEAERSAPAISLSGRLGDGNFEQRAGQFSITKAIGAALGEDLDVGFEREMSAEVRRRNPGRKWQGIAVPDQVFVERRAFGDAVMLIGGGSPAGAANPLYPTQHRPDLFIDRLRAGLIVGALGATVLNDLQGDQDIPKQTGSATGQWLAEDEAISDSSLTFDDVTLSPKTVGSITSYSRRTLINASPSIEQIVRNDLAQVIANAIDVAALLGPGTGNQPRGVRHQSGVAALTLTPTWPEVLAFESTIQMSNADMGTLGWAMAPDAAAVLRQTLRESGDAASGYLMTDLGTFAGRPVAMTTNLSNNGSPATSTVLFGAWSQLLVGYWSGTDILVNPYADSAYQRGRVLVRAMRDADVAVRHAESFAYAEMSVP